MKSSPPIREGTPVWRPFSNRWTEAEQLHYQAECGAQGTIAATLPQLNAECLCKRRYEFVPVGEDGNIDTASKDGSSPVVVDDNQDTRALKAYHVVEIAA